MTTPTQPSAASAPQYSERGPVWIAKAYETTDECAPSSRIAWRVEDLDGHIIAQDCQEQSAKDIANALNQQAAFSEVVEAALHVMDSVVTTDALDGNEPDADLARAIESGKQALAKLAGK